MVYNNKKHDTETQKAERLKLLIYKIKEMKITI